MSRHYWWQCAPTDMYLDGGSRVWIKQLIKGMPIYRWSKTHTSSTSWRKWWETYINKNSVFLFKDRSHSKKGYWQGGSRSPQFISASSFMIYPKWSDKSHPYQYCQYISCLMKVTWWHCSQTETCYNWWAKCLFTTSSINCLRRGITLQPQNQNLLWSFHPSSYIHTLLQVWNKFSIVWWVCRFLSIWYSKGCPGGRTLSSSTKTNASWNRTSHFTAPYKTLGRLTEATWEPGRYLSITSRHGNGMWGALRTIKTRPLHGTPYLYWMSYHVITKGGWFLSTCATQRTGEGGVNLSPWILGPPRGR